MNEPYVECTRLGARFLAKVVHTTCYLVNRSPTTTHECKILQEVWIETPINYSLLRSFSCDAYVWISKEKMAKLDARSKRCIFLRYTNGTKGYTGCGIL